MSRFGMNDDEREVSAGCCEAVKYIQVVLKTGQDIRFKRDEHKTYKVEFGNEVFLEVKNGKRVSMLINFSSISFVNYDCQEVITIKKYDGFDDGSKCSGPAIAGNVGCCVRDITKSAKCMCSEE